MHLYTPKSDSMLDLPRKVPLTSCDSCLLLCSARGPDDGRVDNEVRGVLPNTAEEVRDTLSHVGLWVVQTGEKLWYDPYREKEQRRDEQVPCV